MENKFDFKKRILFFGMPDMGTICLVQLKQAGVNIVGAVPPPPNNPSYGQFCTLAKYLNINIVNYKESLKDADFLKKIKDLNADLAIVCSYNTLFPQELLKLTKDGFVNAHPSLLPLYRGANPYSHPIINGDEKTGVTLHFMNEKFDKGDILVSREVEIDSNETMGTLFNKLNYASADLIIAFLKYYEEKPLTAVPQPEGTYPKGSAISSSDKLAEIDWNKSAKEINALVRALNPFIIAHTFFRNIPIKVYATRVLDKKLSAKPGTILNVEKGLFVNTGDGIIELRIVQVGTFMICDGREFIRKFELKKGERFGLVEET